VSLSLGDGPVRPSRTTRADASLRRRRMYAVVAVLIVVALGLAAWTRFRDGGTAAGASPTATDSTGRQGHGSSELLAFSVTGAPSALLAVVGTGGGQPPAGLVLPPGMTVIVPGQGETPTEQVQALTGDTMRISVSNAVGVWAPHYAVMNLNGFGNAIDGVGGLTVNLADVYTVGGSVLGPGRTHMSGNQVVTFLYEKAEDTAIRWSGVLEAFLKAAPAIPQGDMAETDDPAGAAAALGAAIGAEVQVAPTKVVGATAIVPAQPDFDDLVERLFGTPAPVRAFVQNGSGSPGIGEAVARHLLPQGFRIVLTGNAESFNHDTTLITAIGSDHLEDANRAKDALGVGAVRVSQVPSGLADVTIVVGRDFKG
jgi:LytR cell envelope-related transcriptional attenuator/cell envelope-related transcriptional attenuator-like protein